MDNPNQWKKFNRRKTWMDSLEGLWEDTSEYLHSRSVALQNLHNFQKKMNERVGEFFENHKSKRQIAKEILSEAEERLNTLKQLNKNMDALNKKLKENNETTLDNSEIKQNNYNRNELITELNEPLDLDKYHRNKYYKDFESIVIIPKEPSVDDIKIFLDKQDTINYAETITNAIINFFMFIAIGFLSVVEAGKFIISYLLKIPFRKLFIVLTKIGIIIVSIGMIIFITNFFIGLTAAQKMSDEKVKALELKLKNETDSLNVRLTAAFEEIDYMKAHSVITTHKTVIKEFRDPKTGRVIRKERIE